eukprot:gene28515-31673_t
MTQLGGGLTQRTVWFNRKYSISSKINRNTKRERGREYGFNPGSNLITTDVAEASSVSRTAVCTTLSGATSGILTMMLNYYRTKQWELLPMCAGTIGGLVAITAGCSVVEPWAAIICGAVAAPLVIYGDVLMERYGSNALLSCTAMFCMYICGAVAAPLVIYGDVLMERYGSHALLSYTAMFCMYICGAVAAPLVIYGDVLMERYGSNALLSCTAMFCMYICGAVAAPLVIYGDVLMERYDSNALLSCTAMFCMYICGAVAAPLVIYGDVLMERYDSKALLSCTAMFCMYICGAVAAPLVIYEDVFMEREAEFGGPCVVVSWQSAPTFTRKWEVWFQFLWTTM